MPFGRYLGTHDFFQIFRICFFKDFMKNPQTTIALTFLTHIISGIGGVLLSRLTHVLFKVFFSSKPYFINFFSNQWLKLKLYRSRNFNFLNSKSNYIHGRKIKSLSHVKFIILRRQQKLEKILDLNFDITHSK